MATISFTSPTPPGPIAANGTIRLTIDHDGTLVMVAIIMRFTEGVFESYQAIHVGLLISGFQFLFPYTVTFVSSTATQLVLDVTKDNTGNNPGWDRDFQLSVYTAEGVSGMSNNNASFVSSEPDKSLEVVDPGGAIAPTDHIDVQVNGDVPLDDLEVFFAIGTTDLGGLPDTLRTEMGQFGGIAFPPYTVQDLGGGLLRFTRGDGGWLKSMIVVARSFTAGDAILPVVVFPETEVDPGAAPVVGNLSPAPGTPITTTTPLVFEVTDDSGAFRRVVLAVAYSSGDLAGVTELVHDGDAFVGHYSTGCSRDPISGGFRFTILRAGGWPASPTLRVFAFDRAGNEV